MGDEGLYLSICQINLFIDLNAMSLLLWHFINTTNYHRYKPSYLSSKELLILHTLKILWQNYFLARNGQVFKYPDCSNLTDTDRKTL